MSKTFKIKNNEKGTCINKTAFDEMKKFEKKNIMNMASDDTKKIPNTELINVTATKIYEKLNI